MTVVLETNESVVFCNRTYKSLLHAKWAAVFKAFDWRTEYQPFEIGGWTPDFLLHGSFLKAVDEPGKAMPILVELKPSLDFDQAEKELLQRALETRGTEFQILRLSPILMDFSGDESLISIGWIGQPIGSHEGPHWYWSEAVLGRWERLTSRIGFAASMHAPFDVMFGRADYADNGDPYPYGGIKLLKAEVEGTWNRSVSQIGQP